MACYAPLSAWQQEGGRIVFAERGKILRSLELPCGQCIGCRLERSRQWAVRCMHEASLHAETAFITLTYDDDHLTVDRSLRYRDYQLFMKRLRKFATGSRQRIRFFMCGEYGEQFARPHFHACLFGISFPDRIPYKNLASGFPLYTSASLAKLWDRGFSSVGDVSFESAAYVARYIIKKRFHDVADERSHYRHVDDYGEVHYREPEFAHMSLKPGIGADWFKRFSSDVYPRDFVVVGGRKCKPPKYYDRLLSTNNPILSIELEVTRFEKSKLGVADSTPERLAVREEVAKARLLFKKRTLI